MPRRGFIGAARAAAKSSHKFHSGTGDTMSASVITDIKEGVQ